MAALLLAFLILNGSLSSILFTLALQAYDLWQHSEQRLAELRCNEANSEASQQLVSFFATPIMLGLGQLEPNDQEAFRSYLSQCASAQRLGQASSWTCIYARINLSYGIEIKYSLGWSAILLMLETFAMAVLISIWATLWTLLYALEFVQIVTCLLEVGHQLERCNQRFEQERQEHLMRSKKRRRGHRLIGLNLANSTRIRLDEQLAATYLLYEQFKRQLKPFNKLTQFNTYQASLLASAGLVGLYIVATSLESNSKLFVFLTTLFMLAYMDLFLFAASFTPRQLENLMSQISSLLANLSERKRMAARRASAALIGCASLTKLWQRQLLTEQEIDRISAAKLLGLHVSYRKLIAFNVNLFGLWLIMWRVHSALKPGAG